MRVPRGKGGNEGRPFQGIDTYPQWKCIRYSPVVEMKVAPFRALTHRSAMFVCSFCGNEARPFQGITDFSAPCNLQTHPVAHSQRIQHFDHRIYSDQTNSNQTAGWPKFKHNSYSNFSDKHIRSELKNSLESHAQNYCKNCIACLSARKEALHEK